MPWSVKKGGGDCGESQYAVINDDTGQVVPGGCHDSKSDAEKHQAALYANTDEGESKAMATAPRDDLVRMIPFEPNPQWPSDMVLRMAEDGNTLVGYAAVFGRWTEINSWEGRFKERIQRGAFKRTLKNNRKQIKVLFNHGMDPSIGDKPLGKPKVMKEDDRGLYVEVPLDDTSYNQDLKASLRSGALDGMSFRMNVMREEWDKLEDDMPERTIQEIRMFEFGPVTFPAYEATEAGVRAHAPEAFAAYRAAQQHNGDRQSLVDIARASRTESTSRIGSTMSYVYTPTSWAGWTPHSITEDGVTLYVRNAEGDVPGEQGDVEDPAPTPEPEPVVSDPTDDDLSEKDVITSVESDSVTMAAPDDSVDSDHSDGDDDPSESAHSSDDDDPVDADHSSQNEDEPERMLPWRKTLMLDRINETVERVETVDIERYSHLL